jgi:hypothetical protein
LKVREFAREDERRLCIIFDNPEAGMIPDQAYEKAVDLAASIAWHFSTQEAEVSFVAPGHPRTRDLHEFLAWLAVIKPRSSDRSASAGAAQPRAAFTGAEKGSRDGDPLCELGLTGSDDFNVVVTARARGTVPTAFWNSSYFVFATQLEPAKKRSG